MPLPVLSKSLILGQRSPVESAQSRMMGEELSGGMNSCISLSQRWTVVSKSTTTSLVGTLLNQNWRHILREHEHTPCGAETNHSPVASQSITPLNLQNRGECKCSDQIPVSFHYPSLVLWTIQRRWQSMALIQAGQCLKNTGSHDFIRKPELENKGLYLPKPQYWLRPKPRSVLQGK